jgi:hypothetical protein
MFQAATENVAKLHQKQRPHPRLELFPAPPFCAFPGPFAATLSVSSSSQSHLALAVLSTSQARVSGYAQQHETPLQLEKRA